MRRFVTLLHFVLVSIPSFAAQPTDIGERPMSERSSGWHCKVLKQYACTPHECTERQPDLSISINFKNNEYKRCIQNYCDT